MPSNFVSSIRKLGELAQVVTKGTTPTTLGHDYVVSGIPFIRANNLVGAYVDTAKDVLFIDETTDELLKRSRIFPGDVLLSIAGTIGRASRVPVNAPTLNCNQAVCIIRCTSEIDGDFLRYWLESESARAQIASSKVTGVISNLSLTEVKSLKIPLPPLPEQHRIAAILDKAYALCAKRRESIAKLDQLIDSGFREFCGSPYGPPVSIDKPSQPDAGQYVPLLSVARLATGHTPSRGIAEYWDGDIPWISLSDIRHLDGKIALNTQQHATAKGISNSSAVILPKDTVCFSRTASVGFATILGRQMATSQDFVNWVCSERINPLYLLAAFRASKQYLVAKSTGSTHKTIYFPVAKRFHVYMPPLSEQARFGELMRLVWRQKDAAEQQVSAADRLFSSLQQAAFASQL